MCLVEVVCMVVGIGWLVFVFDEIFKIKVILYFYVLRNVIMIKFKIGFIGIGFMGVVMCNCLID